MDMRLRECELVYRPTTGKAAPNTTIRSSECVYRLFAKETRRVHESLWAVLLDARSRVIATHEVARGGVSSVVIEPASLFRAAVIIGAPALVMVHNHPSGDPTPSAEDLAFTRRVVQGGALLGVKLLDHVVIAESGYYSLLDAGELRTEAGEA